VAALQLGGDGDPLAHARQLAADEGGFDTATSAGVTLTRISRDLEAAADDCASSDGARAARCSSLYAGAGYARVSAAGVLRCTRPGVFDARAELRRYLDALVAGRDPQPPAPPGCS
jgi:hypothetical protein